MEDPDAAEGPPTMEERVQNWMPRVNPAARELLQTVFEAMKTAPPPKPFLPQSRFEPNSEEVKAQWEAQSDTTAASVSMLVGEVEKVPGITEEEHSVRSFDDTYDIKLYVYKPGNQAEKYPIVLYPHGGGMTLGDAKLPCDRLLQCLVASKGAIVVSPEFRNARTFAYPAPVDDCVASLKWLRENEGRLGGNGTLITCGGSGGGTLALATFFRLIELGMDESLINGIIAWSPMTTGNYSQADEEMANHAAFITSRELLHRTALNYTTNKDDSERTSAWPMNASNEELLKLPPLLLIAEECDILSVDTKRFYNKACAAGVRNIDMSLRIGDIHCGIGFRHTPKMVQQQYARNVVAFCHTVADLGKTPL